MPPHQPDSPGVTGLLRAWSEGDRDAFERVLPHVYDELHPRGRALPGGRARAGQPSGHGPGQRVVRAPARVDARPLAESAAVLRRVGADDAPRPGRHRAPAARRPGAAARGDSRLARRRRSACRGAGRGRARGRRGAASCSRASIRARPKWSRCGSLAASPSKRPPRRWASRFARCTADWAFARAWLYRTLTADHVASAAIRWRLADEIFTEAMAQPTAVRAELISRRCGADVDLRDEISGLISASARAGDFLARPALDAVRTADLREGWPVRTGDRVACLHHRPTPRRRRAWERCGARATIGSGATSPSSSCFRIRPDAAGRVAGFGARPAPPVRSSHANILTVSRRRRSRRRPVSGGGVSRRRVSTGRGSRAGRSRCR